jgi:polyvinyl alcohol dehydrogenase (cytochrome)
MYRGFECRVFILTLGLLAMMGCAPTHVKRCSDAIDTSSAVLSNGFAFNLSNTSNNASQINSGNVATLKLALTDAASGVSERRGAPAMTRQALFFAAGRNVVAMNRTSGCQYWSYTIPDKRTLAGSNAVRSSSVYYLNEGGSKPALILVGDFYANFYAIAAKTGKLLWTKFIGTDKDHHMITGGAQFYEGKLLVPVASKEVITALLEFGSDCCKSHGMLEALDPYTGKIFWTYDTAPEAILDKSTHRYSPNGMSIWSTPAIDAARGSIYMGTGQNYTPPTTSNEDSIVALEINTGRPKWVFQGSSGDAWNTSCQSPVEILSKNCLPAPPGGGDLDFGAPPILAHLSNGADRVIAGEKSGVLFSLDPDTGRVNWSVRLGAGGNIGGIHWGMAADAHRVYVGISDVTVNKITRLNVDNLIDIRKLVGSNIEQSPHAKPGVYAVDLLTGQVAWERHPKHSYDDPAQGALTVDSIYSAAISVTNDVVFAGSLDGVVKAFRTSDGSELWSYDTTPKFTDGNGTSGNGGTIDSGSAVPGGTDLLVNSGFSTFGGRNRFQAGPGNALLVFRLPGALEAVISPAAKTAGAPVAAKTASATR